MNFYLATSAIIAACCISIGSAAAGPRAAVSGGMAPGGVCVQLERIITSDEMDASDATNDETTEDSAIRATVEEGKVAAAYLEIQANLTLMAQNHCAPLSHPIVADYLMAALQCKNDMMQKAISGAGSTGLPDSCDRSKWKRDFEQVVGSGE